MERLIQSGRTEGGGETLVKEIRGGGKSFSPKMGRKMCMDEKSTHNIINGANYVLSLAVLLGSVWGDRRRTMPLERKKVVDVELMNSFPLLVRMDLIGRRNCVCVSNKMA